jgi:pyrimidine dimer DNA glycosylase
MRVWSTPPHLLCTRHLLGEHNEIHTLIKGFGSGRGYDLHPQAQRFVVLGSSGLDLLRLRHELIRCAMERRWPGNHDSYVHPTPAEPEMAWRFEMVRAYEHLAFMSPQVEVDWMMHELEKDGWPGALDHDHPWQRDRMTLEQYVGLGHDGWTREYHSGDRPEGSQIGWTRRPTDEAMDRLTEKGIVYVQDLVLA